MYLSHPYETKRKQTSKVWSSDMSKILLREFIGIET